MLLFALIDPRLYDFCCFRILFSIFILLLIFMFLWVDLCMCGCFWIIGGVRSREGEGLQSDGIILLFMHIIKILWDFLRVHWVNKNKIMILPLEAAFQHSITYFYALIDINILRNCLLLLTWLSQLPWGRFEVIGEMIQQSQAWFWKNTGADYFSM